MYRIDSANSVPSPPAPTALGTEGYCKDGSTGGGDGTVIDADFVNMLQESLIALLDDQGIAHGKSASAYGNVLAAIRGIADDRIAVPIPSTRGSISGFLISNATGDPLRDITVTPGECRNAHNDAGSNMSVSLTKQIDAGGWTAGDNAGGLPSSVSLNANTWYTVFALADLAGYGSDIGFDTSTAAANLLTDATVIAAGHVRYRQIGWVLTDGASNIVAFRQSAEEPSYFAWDQPPTNLFAGNWDTALHTYGATAPPNSVAVLSHFIYTGGNSFGTVYIKLFPTAQTDVGVGNGNYTFAIQDTNTDRNSSNTVVQVMVDAVSNYRWRASSTGGSNLHYINTLGYRYNRGAQ